MVTQARSRARLAALVLSTAAVLAGCGGGGGGGVVTPATPTPWALHATTGDGLTTYLRAALGASTVPYFMGAATAGSVTVPMPSAASAAVSFSGTTLQEQGVDEDDLIKSDGAFVFSLDQAATASPTLQRNVLRRQRLNASASDAALTPVDSFTVPFSADVRGQGLYLDSDRQQVIAIGKATGAWGIYDQWFAPQPWSVGAAEVAMIGAAAGAPMQTAHKLRIDAQLIGTRRIGATLYLVLRSYPRLPGFDPYWQGANTASNSALLETLQAQQALPTVSVDGAAPQPLVSPSSCFVQDGNAASTADIVTLVAVDLASGAQAARCFAGRTEAFYMSASNVYLATTRSSYGASGGSLVYAAQASTDIHKFALDGSTITYRGSGNVPGHLGFDQNRKSFRMGEHQDALGVITQLQTGPIAVPVALPPIGTGTGSGTGTPGSGATGSGTAASTESPAQLTILQDQGGGELVAVAHLPNAARPDPIGKAGELLYASRFVGTRAYIVTYRLIDPLYVLDLSNPADPKVAGQLQVPGYADYLFPLSDTLLLGVGKDAIADGGPGDGRFAWYQGVQVSLIDVSDPAHPVQAARQVIGHRGTTATVLSDHHGIAIQQAGTGARISLPVSVHDTPPPQPTGAPSDYWQFTRTELQRFQVDLAAGQLVQLPALAGSVASTGERPIANDRSLLWANQVHWYQDGVWRSGAW